jgi:hypothetical protein
MEKWEYLTRFIFANQENTKADESLKFYQEQGFTDFKPGKYSPQFMISILNGLGAQGWELVHMEPVPEVGDNHDVGFPHGGANLVTWSHVYFCVFKRKVPE